MVWTNATTSVSDAEVKRLVIAPHFKAGYQLITSKRFVFEISAGLGPGFVFSKSSIPQENLGSKSYQYGILYEGGSGVYLSSHLDFKFGYLINSK
ncbi:MAG: hypothetical protein IPF68_02690 [Bacteroidales bacterium]|nr:hypothetical protein [Bacteroidales bacterium]